MPANEKKGSSVLQMLITGVVCIICAFVFGHSADGQSTVVIKIGLFIVLFLCALMVMWVLKTKALFAKNMVAVSVVFFALCTFVSVYSNLPNRVFSLVVFGLVLVAGVAIYLYCTKQLTYHMILTLLVVAGFVVKLGYTLSTDASVHVRQHDVYSFGNGSGHSGYIEYFYNNWHLPDFDPQTVNQFYHPPLHHFLAAVWLKVQTAVGILYNTAANGIKFLTLFYANCSVILAKRIFEETELKKESLIFSTALVAFCPVFIIFSASVNNDILSVLFILATILSTIKWSKSGQLVHLLQTALFIGLGMSTKASVATIAFPVGLFMLCKLWSSEQKAKQIRQYALFAGVVFPLGLWWPIRNFLLFGSKLSYVPRLSDNSTQFVGYRTLLERYVPFYGMDRSVYITWGDFPEYNVWTGLFKTSAFGEFRLSNYSIWADRFAGALLACTIVVCVVAFACMLYSIFAKKGHEKQTELFLFGVYIVFVVSYLVFCYQFPHTCTINVRYVSPLVIVGAFFIGNVIKLENKGTEAKHSTKTVAAEWGGFALKSLVALYCISSCLVYIGLTIPR